MVCVALHVDCPIVRFESAEVGNSVGAAHGEVQILAEENLKGSRMATDTWQQMMWHVVAYHLKIGEYLRVNLAAS